MSDLKTHLNHLDFPSQLADVKKIIDPAQPKVSFWGARVVTVNGYTGYISLDALAYKLYMAAEHRSKADDLTPVERIHGVDSSNKLVDCYRITDTQIKNANFLTRLFVRIREFSFCSNCCNVETPRYLLNDSHCLFRCCSQAKFTQKFDPDPQNGSYMHPSSDGNIGEKIILKEALIRAQL